MKKQLNKSIINGERHHIKPKKVEKSDKVNFSML